jgi:hypothetical protein
MSLIRLVMLDLDEAKSGLIPSRAIGAVLFAVSQNPQNIRTFWEATKAIDPNLELHFQANADPSPLLEGIGDGLLVISWEHKCIESFQEFQPVGHSGIAVKHNGTHSLEGDTVHYSIPETWHIVDHLF